MIHKVSDGYIISSGGSWKPGVYDSERTARYAFRFKDDVLQRLQDSKYGNIISTSDLKSIKQ